MSGKFVRSLIFIFNFYSFSSLRLDAEGELKLSKFFAWKNLIYLPLVILLRIVLQRSLDEAPIDNDMFAVTSGISVFFVYIISFMMSADAFMLILSIYIQWRNRDKILTLINECLKFHRRYDVSKSQNFKSAERKFYKKCFVFLILFFAVQVAEFFITMNKSWQGVLLYILTPFKSFTCLLLYAFFNCFLCYFVFLIKHLNTKLQQRKIGVHRDSRFDQLSSFTMDLHQLMIGFGEALGSVLTLSVVLITAINTIRVRSLEIMNATQTINLNSRCIRSRSILQD